jgi:hypothetical protein
MSDVIYTEPVYTERADTAIATPTRANSQETDWSGWEKWLRGHLDIERQFMFESIAQEIAERDHQIHELELKLGRSLARSASSAAAEDCACVARTVRAGTNSTTSSYSTVRASLRPGTIPARARRRVGNCWLRPAAPTNVGSLR